MSCPMEISAPPPLSPAGAAGAALPECPSASSSPAPAPASTLDDRVLVSVEVCLKASSTARVEDVRTAVERMLENRSLSYIDGPVPVPLDDLFLVENVKRIAICDTDELLENHKILLFWQVRPVVHVYQLSEEGPGEDPSGDEMLSSFNEWILPAKEFDGMWESLIYETSLKQRLLRYAASALLFTEKGVDPCLVSWNRIILLHGPPGTGKTSLCKALAQKLSIRFKSRYSMCQLVEVNAHSLFSKWFSESGKLVAKLFQKIQEMVEEESNLVFVLIDIAFVDRADIKAYVGPPTLQARYEILRSCIQELIRTGIIICSQDHVNLELPSYLTLKEKLHPSEPQESQGQTLPSRLLLEAAEVCQGLSGRALRKLPFLAHASVTDQYSCDPSKFLHTLIQTARRELAESRA